MPSRRHRGRMHRNFPGRLDIEVVTGIKAEEDTLTDDLEGYDVSYTHCYREL